MAEVSTPLGPLRLGRRNPEVEGTPEEIRDYKRGQVRLMRVLAARGRAGWTEFQEESLSRVGGFFVDRYGDLLEVMPAHLTVFEPGGPRIAFNESMVVGFIAKEDGPVLLRRPEGKVRTLAQLNEQQQKRAAELERRERYEAQAAERLAEFRRAQPLVPLDAGPLTIRAAAEKVLDLGGWLEVGPNESLLILLPARLHPDKSVEESLRAELVGAAEVLRAAAPIVVGVLGSGSQKTIVERLPDVRAGFAGGTVKT